MKMSIFLSYPKPHLVQQEDFIRKLKSHLKNRGFAPRTLGVTDYDMDVPLKAIRRLMMESHGLITVAFRRTYVNTATIKKGANLSGQKADSRSKYWLTSPYCQIEPAMAYQIGLPSLILREKGVAAEGLLEKGVVGTYMPEFELGKKIGDYLVSPEWADLIGKWEGLVRIVVEGRANPPKLY